MSLLLRWHTPTPPQPVAQTTAAPALVSSDRLASLMKQTHYRDSNLTDLEELDILAEYSATFPARWTDDMRRQPKRYVYQMMAELEVENNPVGATQLAQELQQQLSAASGDRTTKQHEPSIGESVRDHLGADNIIRHMHRTPSAYNRGPPIGKDPYLGTGLNPAHVSGVVSPNDGLAPEMACCGQPLGSPGCWIPLETGQLKGMLIPYKVWFSDATAAAAVWQQIILNPNAETLIDATVTGTAFLRESYYRELDTQIRVLVRQLAPAIVRVHQQLLAGSFTQPSLSGVALLSVGEQESLVQLVALVQRYNAPQMGACHHDRSITGDYLDEHVFFISVGREEFRAGRLVTEIDVQGRKVPLVGQATAEAFRKTAEALSYSDTLRRTFLTASTLVSLAVTEQLYLQRRGSEAERVFGSIERGFNSIGLPNVLQSERVKWSNVYQAANQLARELEKLIGGLPLLANIKLRNDKDDGFVRSLDNATAKLDELKKLFLSFPKLNTSDEINKWFTVSDEKISVAIAKDPFLNQPDVRNLPQVQRWARAVVVQQNGISQLDQEVDRLFEIAKVAALQEKVRQEEAAKRVSPSPQEPSGRNVEVSVAPANLPPINSANWDIRRSFAYAEESCTYDALFAALFVIPNQWFREVVVNARRIVRQPQCAESAALSIHRTMVETIKYMEHNLEKPDPFQTVCPNRAIWSSCLPTEANQGRFGNPIILFRNLCGFYDAEYGFAYFETPYGNWNPLYDERRQSELLQMYGIRVKEPPVGQEHTIQGQYAIEPVQGSFTMISCLIYTNGHWQACIRDPRTGIWYRMLDSGYPKELGTDPAEIKSVTTTDPKRPGVKYEPYVWFYVRTERLLEFDQLETNPIFTLLENNRRKFHENRSIIDAESDYIVLVDILETLEKIALVDVKEDENFFAREGFEYFDNKTWQTVGSSFGLAGFIISFLLGSTGVLPDASLRVIPSSDQEFKESVTKNAQKYRLAWEAIRPIFIPLFKRMGLLAMDDWSSYRDDTTVDGSMKKWGVDMRGLVGIWERISKLLKIAAVPPTTKSGRFNPTTKYYRDEFIATYDAVWMKVQ